MSTAIFIFALFGVACLARPNDEGGALQEFQIINPERVFVENPDLDEETIEEDGVVDENDIPFKRHRRSHGCPFNSNHCRRHCGGMGHCGGFLNFKCKCGHHGYGVGGYYGNNGHGGHHGGGGGHYGGRDHGW